MGFSFNLNDLNPLNYLSKAVGNAITSTVLPLIYAFFTLILSIFQYIFQTFFGSVNIILWAIYESALYLGPFGLPLFTSGILFILMSIQVFFKFAHNLPVVGDFL